MLELLLAVTLAQPAPLRITPASILGYNYSTALDEGSLRVEARISSGSVVSSWRDVPIARCVNCSGAPEGQATYEMQPLDARLPRDTPMTLELRVCDPIALLCGQPVSQPIIIVAARPPDGVGAIFVIR